MQIAQTDRKILCIIEDPDDLDKLSELRIPEGFELGVIRSIPGEPGHQVTVSSQRELDCIVFGMFLGLSMNTETKEKECQ